MRKRLRPLQYFNAGSPGRGVRGRGSAAPGVRVGQERHAGLPPRRPSTPPRPARPGQRGPGDLRRLREGEGAGSHRRSGEGAAHKPGTAPPEGWPGGGDSAAAGMAGRGDPFKRPPAGPARRAGAGRAQPRAGRAGRPGEARRGKARRGGAAHAAAYPPPRTPSPLAGQSAGTACGGRGLGTGVWEGPYRHRATPPPRLRRPRRGPPTAAPPRR